MNGAPRLQPPGGDLLHLLTSEVPAPGAHPMGTWAVLHGSTTEHSACARVTPKTTAGGHLEQLVPELASSALWGPGSSADTRRLLGVSPSREIWGTGGQTWCLWWVFGVCWLEAAGKGPRPRGVLVAPLVRPGQHPPRPPPCRIPSSLDNSLLHAIETIIIDWSHQVRDVLSKDSAQALLDGMQPLPRVEFEFWDARLMNLKCIHDQVPPPPPATGPPALWLPPAAGSGLRLRSSGCSWKVDSLLLPLPS